MYIFRNFLAFIILLPCAILMAYAIGDNGGCLEFNSTSLGKALQEGEPQDVKREIANWIDKFAPKSFWPKSREHAILNLIEGNHEKGTACAPGPLLPVALNAGNIEVTKFLLTKPFGIDPKVPHHILFSTCDHQSSMSEEKRNARRRALEILLDTKAVDINILRNGRYPILLLCKQPELVALYLERGARADIEVGDGENLLEAAVRDALTTDENSPTAKSLKAVERARLFARIMPDAIAGRPFEKRVLSSCTPGVRTRIFNPRTCQELSTFIKASPGVFGEAR